MILRKDGRVMVCGNNSDGQIGLGVDIVNTEGSFTFLEEDQVKNIFCGKCNSMIYKRNGDLLVMGKNEKGELVKKTSFKLFDFVKSELKKKRRQVIDKQCTPQLWL